MTVDELCDLGRAFLSVGRTGTVTLWIDRDSYARLIEDCERRLWRPMGQQITHRPRVLVNYGAGRISIVPAYGKGDPLDHMLHPRRGLH